MKWKQTLVFLILLTLCTSDVAFSSTRFLSISDIHYGHGNSSKDGQDTGDELLNTSFTRFRTLVQDVDFILLLGDLPTHGIFSASKKEDYEKTVFHGLYALDPQKPMFYITGNNDSLAGNYQPFEVEGKSPLNQAVDWSGACAYCDGLMIDDRHMAHGGYYSSYVIPNNKDIMLIALNTIQWAKTSIWLPKYPSQERDAQEQLDWLEAQLKSHQAKQLLIAMHVPPGKAYNNNELWHEAYVERFINLLKKYHDAYDEITLLGSHTHMDEIRKIDLGDVRIYMLATPSISRDHHNNPGIKVFELNKQCAIKNFKTYYTWRQDAWGSEEYQALGAPDAMFPNCTTDTLAQCLDEQSDEQVCDSLEAGLFFGVKSPRVPQKICSITYRVGK